MQGSILRIASMNGQGLIQGDDGVRYTFTLTGWRDNSISPAPGMRVDFEERGSHSVGIYPLPGAAPTMPTSPVPLAAPYAPYPQPALIQQPPLAAPYAPAQPPAPPVQSQAPPPAPSPAVSVQSSTPKSSSLDAGKIVGGTACMFLLSAFLGIFLPLIGPMIGGFVGGRVSGSFANAVVAALISAVAIGGFTFLIVAFIVSFIEGLPLIGGIIMATPIGEILTGGAVVLALFSALPMLVFALIGGATAKKEKPDVSVHVHQGPN